MGKEKLVGRVDARNVSCSWAGNQQMPSTIVGKSKKGQPEADWPWNNQV